MINERPADMQIKPVRRIDDAGSRHSDQVDEQGHSDTEDQSGKKLCQRETQGVGLRRNDDLIRGIDLFFRKDVRAYDGKHQGR